MVIFFALSCGPAKSSLRKTRVEEGGFDEVVQEESDVDQPVSAEKGKDVEEKSGEVVRKSYDGLKYVGPARRGFVVGVESYFSEGCGKAIDSWEKAFEKDDLNARIAYNVALCYQREGKISESKRWYLKSFELEKSFVEPLYNFAAIDLKEKKFKKDFYVTLMKDYPDEVVKSNFFSWLSLKLKNYDEAILFAKSALKNDEQNVDAMVNMGTAYYHKEMFELAGMIFSTAEKIDENNFRLQRMMGFLSYREGKTAAATDHFQKAKRLNPELPEVSNMLAVLAMEIESFEIAKNELEFSLGIAPDFHAAKINLAIAMKGLAKFKEARKLLSEIEGTKDLPIDLLKSVYYNTAILYLDSDVDGDQKPERFDLSISYFEKYLKLVPKRDRDEIKKVRGYIKEAGIEKKKLVRINKMRARMEAKRRAAEEEAKAFDELKRRDAEKMVDSDAEADVPSESTDEDSSLPGTSSQRIEEKDNTSNDDDN